jgi:hypothetical protein
VLLLAAGRLLARRGRPLLAAEITEEPAAEVQSEEEGARG